MEDERGDAVPDCATFARTLGTLKQEGSNILLVGTSKGPHETVCQQLLGATRGDARYRLFVTNAADHVAHECRADPEIERVQTIEYSQSGLESRSESDGKSGQPSLGTLGIEIVETIGEFDDSADGLAPSALRVCVDSLVPLLQEYDAETVFRLLQLTTSRVDQACGMGHYHLPLGPDHDAVNLFEPMFDAVVTVRSRNGTDEQQWYLREADTTTDWLEL
ncbi:DUF7504 family protein [Natrinema gari]|uniref:KaiC-like domain-containing protein n=1 Tax=Natrinema gari JCM 14663 TaxID=1230459 RepID=L9YRH1_9EURY|nr:hypothetical protein [Natrinema gari]ELY75488.1 hypothetical protein C486_19848 [Natrinema gari JCM 14663]